MSVPRDPSEHPLDWEQLRASIRRRVAFHLQGAPPEEIEDATQDVVIKTLRFLERSGPPDSMDGLLTVIARRTAAERIRARTRRPRHEPIQEASAVTMDDALRHELAELEAQVQWRATQVLAFFRERHAPCLELAEARARGMDFKRLATETHQSHAALLQRWSRCMRHLRHAVSSGALPWTLSGEDA